MAIKANESLGYIGIGFGRVHKNVDMMVMTKANG